jgi:hypothetical protein
MGMLATVGSRRNQARLEAKKGRAAAEVYIREWT